MSKVTIYQEACNQVKGFQEMGETFMRRLVIDGRSKSTHENYLRQFAKLALHYKQLPLRLDTADLEEYLYFLIQNDTASQSSFKHLIYGLRKLFLLFDQEELHVCLPKISRSKKLPVVLSHPEIKRLLLAPCNMRERVMFGFVYDTGLRISELTNLLIGDVDLDRKRVHVRESKYKKDRYVTLSDMAASGLTKHLTLNRPKLYLFEHASRKGIPICKTQVRRFLKEAIEKANIRKNVCVHTLRHTYATHQLEAGQNIVSLKEALGHTHIETTLVYLHVAKINPAGQFGCLEKLYGKPCS
jgi:site-specific recombinase XerD